LADIQQNKYAFFPKVIALKKNNYKFVKSIKNN